MSITGIYRALAQGGRVYECPKCQHRAQVVDVRESKPDPEKMDMYCEECQEWSPKPVSTVGSPTK